MLITADWVLPVSRPPIRDGAILIEHGRVVETGRADELAGLPRATPRSDYPGCIITPGLVNAHTHLSLTAMGGLFEPGSFEAWLPRLVTAMRSWTPDDHAASAGMGARHCLRSGVTVVGDIVYGPESSAAAFDAGLGGAFYWEVLGIEASELYAVLERMDFPLEGCVGPRALCGLSPHSVYTAGPQLLQEVHRCAREMGAPFAIHVAESTAELDLLRDGSGPLAATAARLAIGFEPPGIPPLAYLDQLGVLEGGTCVHLGHALPTDIPRLASTARGAVACPRSNAFLDNPTPRVSRLMNAGVPVGIGTDSSASNRSLDLMEEIRALRHANPSIPATRLVEMATAMGAVALGLEDRFGMLETGMQADLAIWRLGQTDLPEEAFVRLGGAPTLEAVMSAGTWRVLEGDLVQAADELEHAAAQATERARIALAKA